LVIAVPENQPLTCTGDLAYLILTAAVAGELRVGPIGLINQRQRTAAGPVPI
jgi:hypothetical protein